jgi:hypothetical protein
MGNGLDVRRKATSLVSRIAWSKCSAVTAEYVSHPAVQKELPSLSNGKGGVSGKSRKHQLLDARQPRDHDRLCAERLHANNLGFDRHCGAIGGGALGNVLGADAKGYL